MFALRCRGCGRPRGFLERAAASFITEIINRFGVPTQPITLRQHDNMQDGSPPAAPAPFIGGGTEEVTEMGIGRRKSGNEILPSTKYDARYGGIHTQDRVMGNAGWETEQKDVTHDFRAIFDMPNLQKGWIDLPKGAPPVAVLVPVGAEHDAGEPPNDNFKEGLRLLVKMDDGVVRELLSTALAFWNGIDALHNAYIAGLVDHPGELPVVTLEGTRENRTANGTSYVPVFAIVGYVARPPELPLAGIPMRTAPTKPAPTTTGIPMRTAPTKPAATTTAIPVKTVAMQTPPAPVRSSFDDEIPF
jgi:hypothetical protein